MKRFVLFLLLFSVAVAAQTTRNAASCSQADVQTQVTASADGDTINIPAGTCSWTTGISTGKAIKFVGAGAGRVVATSLTTKTISGGTLTVDVATSIGGTPPATAALSTLGFTNGQTLHFQELGFRANFTEGTVSSWNSGTGVLVLSVTSSGGTCGTSGPPNTMDSNCARWLISTLPSTVITNNAGTGTIFDLTESTAGDIVVSGIKFAAGTGTGPIFRWTRTTNGKPIIVHDTWWEVNGSAGISMFSNTNRGLIYNTTIENSPFNTVENIQIKDDANVMSTSWTTASTWGTADSSSTAFCSTCAAGENNFYLESSDIHASVNFTNFDNNARAVVRYNFFNNAGTSSHGSDTSNYGNRHFEIYNNFGYFQGYNSNFPVTHQTYTANMNWWIHVRGGSMLDHDNVFPALSSTDYGTKNDIHLSLENLSRNGGPHPCWGFGTTGGSKYYAPRQTGMGYVTGLGTTTGPQNGPGNCGSLNYSGGTFSGSVDSCTYVGDSEPIYSWNNKRATSDVSNTAMSVGFGTDLGECTGADSTTNYIQSGRDYFSTTGTAKPGYTPFTYPHPLAGGGGTSSAASIGSTVTIGSGVTVH